LEVTIHKFKFFIIFVSSAYQHKILSSHASDDAARWREVDGKVAGESVEGVVSQRLKLKVGQDDWPAGKDQKEVVRIFLLVHSLKIKWDLLKLDSNPCLHSTSVPYPELL